MENSRKSNFDFLKDIDNELYKDLFEAERNSRLNYKDSIINIRNSLEKIVRYILNQKGYEVSTNLSDNITTLIKECRYFNFLGRLKYETVSNGLKDNWSIHFIRLLGNNAAHTIEKNDDFPKINFANISLALQKMHLLAIHVYAPNTSNKFSEKLMPIGDYIITEYKKPYDSAISLCDWEFYGYSNGEKATRSIDNYCIIRVYNKLKMDKQKINFITRGKEAFEIAENTRAGARNIVETVNLTNINSNKFNEFYLVAYLFSNKPVQLSNKVVQNMKKSDLLYICRIICETIINMHKANIFHRLINYSCVYLCEVSDGWKPYIGKLEYAKLEINNAETVVMFANDAARNKEALLRDYIAPEWDNAVDSELDYRLIDIYALGYLFINTLAKSYEEVSVYNQFDKLNKFGYSKELIEELENMIINHVSFRSQNLDKIMSLIRIEEEKWMELEKRN